MHGSIELTSTPAVGSIATFTLPLKVSSWSGDIPITRSASDSQLLAQSLRRNSTHREILNQEISNIVSSGPDLPRSEHRRRSHTEKEGDLSTLTRDERSHIHVLVVEDK
jgi:hypothetical protein